MNFRLAVKSAKSPNAIFNRSAMQGNLNVWMSNFRIMLSQIGLNGARWKMQKG